MKKWKIDFFGKMEKMENHMVPYGTEILQSQNMVIYGKTHIS